MTTTPTTYREQMLSKIPPEVLFPGGVKGRPRPSRVGALAAWCERHGFRPTLAEVEAERERRRSSQGKQVRR